MVFTCALCKLIPDADGRKTVAGKCKLTADNFAGACVLLRQLWPDHVPWIDALELPATLCLECLPEEARSKITVRKHGKRSEAELLVGLPAAVWDDRQQAMTEGVVVDLAPGGLAAGYIVEWNGGERVQMIDDEARAACALGRWLRARDAGATGPHETRSRGVRPIPPKELLSVPSSVRKRLP